MKEIINSSIWILPLENHLYKVGATYNWQDKTNQKTEAGKLELLTSLKELITCDFEIVEHIAGVRPTVKDRRPLLGKHHLYNNLYILNGQSANHEFLGKTFNQREYQLCKNQENQVFLIGKNDFFSLNSNKVHQYSQPVDSLFKQMNLSSLQWVAANNKIYLTSSSGGYLFEFNEKGIKRIDNSSIERAYYSSAFFTNDNKLYKLGGYGFWEFKSQLLKFSILNLAQISTLEFELLLH